MALLRVGIVIVGLLSVGCALERPEGHFPDRDAGPAVDMFFDGGVRDGGAGEVLEDMTGEWVLFTEDRICIYGDVGDPVENIIWSSYLIRIGESAPGSALLQHDSKMCEQRLSPLPFGFLSIVPRAFTDVLPEVPFSGFIAGREVGSAYVTEPFFEFWGIDGVGPTDEMPEDASDPRVVDQDADDKPGVTFPVTTPEGVPICEVQVAQRNRVQLEGTIVDASQVAGSLEVRSDKIILSASSALCDAGQVGPSDGSPRFVMLRLSGPESRLELAEDDGIGCRLVNDERLRIEAAYGFEPSAPDGSNCPPLEE